jgi:hypothetical protein
MDENLAAKVQRAIARRNPSAGPVNFMDRVQHAINAVSQEVPEVAACAAEDIAVVSAMTLLGPAAHEAGPPPKAQQQHLLELLHQYAVESPLDRLDEMTTAYGCGFGRTCTTGRGISWEHRWANALNALTRRAIRPAVDRVHRWLAQQRLPGYPEKRPAGEREADACRLTLMFVQPVSPLVCEQSEVGRFHAAEEGGVEVTLMTPGRYTERVPAGSRFLFTPTESLELELGKQRVSAAADARVTVLARDDDARIYPGQGFRTVPAGVTATLFGPAMIHVWHCTCGWLHCLDQHRLESWDPARHSLWNFGANAICGPNVSLQLGSLLNGMYLPFLIHEGW